MPLQQTSAEAVETATVYSASVSDVMAGEAGTNHDTPRYDASTVKEILAQAEAMQAHHRATLTPDAIIALGQEIGVEPEFVRRALAHTDAKAMETTTPSPRRRIGRGEKQYHSPHSLTRRQRAAVLIPATIYLLLFPFILFFNTQDMNLSSDTCLWFFIVFPTLLALCVGRAGKSTRVGAMGGGLLGAAVTLSLMIVQTFHHLPMPSLNELLPVLTIFAGSGMVLGAANAALYQIIFRRPRKRLRVRFVVETEEVNHAESISEWA